MGRERMPIRDRLLSKVDSFEDPDECWTWTGRRDPDGYGTLWVVIDGTKRMRFAHRMSFNEFKGDLIEGLTIDHLCLNKSCINPRHLEQVTARENTQRHFDLQTTCKNGHEITEANSYRTPSGHRSCRECRRIAARRYREKLLASA